MSFIADLREAMLPYDISFDKEVSFIADLREAMLPYDISFDKEVYFLIQESLHDNEYSLHFRVHMMKWRKILDFREPHIPCNNPWILQYFRNDPNVNLSMTFCCSL